MVLLSSHLNFNKEQKKNINTIIMVFVIVYFTDSLLFATNRLLFFYIAKRLGVVALSIVFFLRYFYRHRTFIKRDIITFFMIFSILISMVQAGRIANGYSYITQIACFLFALSFSYEYRMEKFIEKYLFVMKIIAITSLVGYLIGDLLVKVDIIPTITNSTGKSFKSLIFTNIPLTSFSRRRNWGPFWEPGVFQVYLNIALFFSLFSSSNKSKIDSVLFLLTLLTTLSGAALIPAILIIGAYLFEKKNLKSGSFVILLGCLLFWFMVTGMYNEILSKIFGGVQNTSFAHRYVSIIANFKSFLRHPFFGASPEYQDELRSRMLYSLVGMNSSGTTNTFISYFSYYGGFVGSVILYRHWKFVKAQVKSNLAAVMVFIAIFIATSNENLTASLLICVLPFLMSVNRFPIRV